MKKLLFFLFHYLICVSLIAHQIVVIDKYHPDSSIIIQDVLSIQKSLIVSPHNIPETFQQTGFLLVPMTSAYVSFLLEQKGGQILCAYLDQMLVGYIILTEPAEFEELYKDPHTGRFDPMVELTDLHAWLSDPAVGYIEQIGIKPQYTRKGIGSQLIASAKAIKPNGLISDIFSFPAKNNASLHFFSQQGFTCSGVLYQSPDAHVNFPYEHRTQVFFWRSTL